MAMDADNSFYVKFIATEAPTFFGYIISVLAMVTRGPEGSTNQAYSIYFVSLIWFENFYHKIFKAK